ncbi:MAG TPA: porin [Burkholderiaceae bacterium]|jgi:predicted porin
MKKSLLALAILGAFASAAQAQVTIGGVAQMDLKDYKVGNTTRVVKNEIRLDDDYSSRFWLTGTEDLGGGNAALFYIENRLNLDVGSTGGNGNGLTNGDSFVGFKGSWGQLTAGKHTMMYVQGLATEQGINGVPSIPLSMYGSFDILSSINGTSITTSRVQNSVLYKSPTVSGFSGSLGWSTSTAGTEGTINGTTTYQTGGGAFAQAGYSNGPIYANIAYWKESSEGQTGSDKTEYRLSGSYSFPFGLKIGAQYDKAKSEVSSTNVENGNRGAWEVPISYTFGSNKILGSYTRAGDNSVAGTTVKNSGAKMFVLGYDYAFSKRTNIGLYYSKLKNDIAGAYTPFSSGTSANGSTLLAGESATILALSLKHTF